MSAAWETHPDAQEENNPGILLRLSGMAEVPGDVSLASLRKACKANAENGNDPFACGTVEVGLFLGLTEYESLREYAKGLNIVYPKNRRRS